MFDIKKGIQARTTFRGNAAKFLKHLKKTRKLLILTINGKAEAVVQDAEAYQRLLDIAAQADASEGVRQGLEEAKKGSVRPARETLETAPARPCHASLGLPGAPCATWKPFTNSFKLIVLNRLRPSSTNCPRRFIVCSNIPTAERSFKPNIYRIIYAVDKRNAAVDVLHIRHGARNPLATK
jgi:PHD/YefM family antitoxin component YafN of YafNO toxin-antitoxin module